VLEVRQLSKEYETPAGSLTILQNINLQLNRGDSASVMGPSGSGKSTLLYILGALESPTSGDLTIDAQNPFRLPERELAQFRNRQIGFVFQDHCLLPQCTVLENVLAPALVRKGENYEEWARELIARVGLEHRTDHYPGQLSGGEKQRAAIARALVLKPPVVLCDEPTGNLDRETAESVAALLLELHRQQNNILIIVTHSPELAAKTHIRCRFEGHTLQCLK
jgi:lipoprotein-releasing system ATP-binding protein